jgi:hypothetical protein
MSLQLRNQASEQPDLNNNLIHAPQSCLSPHTQEGICISWFKDHIVQEQQPLKKLDFL